MATGNRLVELLKHYNEKLHSFLVEQDLAQLYADLLEYGVISNDVKNKLTWLDQGLHARTQVRYLLQQVGEGEKEDNQVYAALMRVLETLGGGKRLIEDMEKELARVKEGKVGTGTMGGDYPGEKDIPSLLETISEYYKWEEIGIALGLPKSEREECRKKGSDVLRLSDVLLAWMRLGGCGVGVGESSLPL